MILLIMLINVINAVERFVLSDKRRRLNTICATGPANSVNKITLLKVTVS